MQDGDSDDDADDGSSGDADHRLVLGDDDGSSSDADKVSGWVPGQNVGSYISRAQQPDHQCQVLVCSAMTTLNGLPKTSRRTLARLLLGNSDTRNDQLRPLGHSLLFFGFQQLSQPLFVFRCSTAPLTFLMLSQLILTLEVLATILAFG